MKLLQCDQYYPTAVHWNIIVIQGQIGDETNVIFNIWLDSYYYVMYDTSLIYYSTASHSLWAMTRTCLEWEWIFQPFIFFYLMYLVLSLTPAPPNRDESDKVFLDTLQLCPISLQLYYACPLKGPQGRPRACWRDHFTVASGRSGDCPRRSWSLRGI